MGRTKLYNKKYRFHINAFRRMIHTIHLEVSVFSILSHLMELLLVIQPSSTTNDNGGVVALQKLR